MARAASFSRCFLLWRVHAMPPRAKRSTNRKIAQPGIVTGGCSGSTTTGCGEGAAAARHLLKISPHDAHSDSPGIGSQLQRGQRGGVFSSAMCRFYARFVTLDVTLKDRRRIEKV